MRRKEIEKELAKLQVGLTRLQTRVQATAARIIVVFEGRDMQAGGVISRIRRRTSLASTGTWHYPQPPTARKRRSTPSLHRHFRLRRYRPLRSLLVRLTNQRVMGFCTEEEAERFLLVTPAIEREMVIQNGIILRKYCLDISQDAQRRRFAARITTRSSTGS